MFMTGSDMIRKLLQTQLIDEDEELAYEQVRLGVVDVDDDVIRCVYV